MSDILCVTNRILCKEDFSTRVERLAKAKPQGIILREKDLSETEYKRLARRVLKISQEQNVSCILHSFVNVAKELNCTAIHLPLSILRTLSKADRLVFTTLGTSCHSVEDAKEAEKLGCTYIIAGHIFETDCKKGLEGRGLGFLRDVCKNVTIPVYAIGGINPQNIGKVRKKGAAGACIMSSAMVCNSPQNYLTEFIE